MSTKYGKTSLVQLPEMGNNDESGMPEPQNYIVVHGREIASHIRSRRLRLEAGGGDEEGGVFVGSAVAHLTLATVSYYFQRMFLLTFRSLAFHSVLHRVSFPFHPSPSRPVSFHPFLSCVSSFPGLFVCLLSDSKASGRSLVVYKCSACI